MRKRISAIFLTMTMALSMAAGSVNVYADEDNRNDCVCGEICGENSVNEDCPVCSENYKDCAAEKEDDGGSVKTYEPDKDEERENDGRSSRKARNGEGTSVDNTWSDVVTGKPEGYEEDDGNVTISRAEGLAWFAKQVNEGNSFEGKTISLATALDLSDYEWVPIGTQEHPFSGTFDGNNNKISGMNMTLSETNTTAGLFGRVSNAVIEDVIISDATVKGTVVGEKNPSTNDDRFTGVYIGGIAAGLKEMNSKGDNTVKIINCQAELDVDIQMEDGVYAVIGGVLGWTDSWSGSKADINGTAAYLDVKCEAENGFYRTAIGGATGEVNGKTNVENGRFSLKTSLSGNGFMSGGDSNKAVQIGGVVGGMPGVSNRDEAMINIKKVSCNTEADFSDTNGLLGTNIMETDVGGVFGRGNYYNVEDCFSQIELTGNEEPYHYGNLAGYTYNRSISCERVYTYGLRHRGEFSYENEWLSRESNNGVMPDYPLKDVYYIYPQVLTENVAGVPFQYKKFHDSHKETQGINDNFVYSDGDESDDIEVTPEDGGKTISVTPASEECAVHGEMPLDSEFEIAFTLPVVVKESGTEKYTINTEVKKEPGFLSSASVTTQPGKEAEAGEKVTIMTTSTNGVLDSLTVVTDGGIEIEVTRTDETGHLGTRTYKFTMPDDNVTVTGTFRAKKEEITVLPSNNLDFGTVYKDYTEVPDKQVVTLKNTGEKIVTTTLTLKNETDYFVIEPIGEDWNGFYISIDVGEEATFTVQPRGGLAVGTYSDTIKDKYTSRKYQINLNFKVADDYEISASPKELNFGDMELGDTSPSGKTVEITNEGKNQITVSLPTGLTYFDVSTADDWQDGKITLASQAKTTVTVTPKIDLGLTKDDPYIEKLIFQTDYGKSAEVWAYVWVVEPTYYTITATAGMNGSIDPAGAVQVNKGDDQTFTITPEKGYEIEDVAVNGVSVGVVDSYTFYNVQAPQTIYASFKPIVPNTFTITAYAGAHGSISPDGVVPVNEGDNKTFTISPDNGYEIEDVMVDGVSVGAKGSHTFENVTANHTISATFDKKSDGSSSSYGGSYSLDNGYFVRYHDGDDTVRDGEYDHGDRVVIRDDVFAAPSGMELAGWSLEEGEDVDYEAGDVLRMPDHSVDLYAVWEETDEVYHKAYMNGYPDGTFGPERTITRAEAAQLLYGLLDDKTGGYSVYFTDVDNGAWYAEAVKVLSSKGIIAGSNGMFEPDRPVTRAEFAAMAARFAGEDGKGVNVFSDVFADEWYYGAVSCAAQNGWISGYPDGTFRPQNSITRAEAVTIVNKMLGRAPDEYYIYSNRYILNRFTDVSEDFWGYYQIIESAVGHYCRPGGDGENWSATA